MAEGGGKQTMRRLLIVTTCLVASWPVPGLSDEGRWWDFAGTQVSIDKQADGSERATIRRNGAEPVVIASRAMRVREPAGLNVTGGDTPQLVLTTWSGEEGCCYRVHLVELGENPHLIQSFDLGRSDIDIFNQFDDDPALEIGLPDWSFAGWPHGFAFTPVPRVILHWDGQQYVPSAKLMRAGIMLYQMQERRQPNSAEETAGAIFKDTLDMIYAGRMKAARTLLRQLLPRTKENQVLERAFFDCKLPASPWWPFVASLNNLPAKPPSASCNAEQS